jgi:zinc transporter ZupT
MNKSNKIINKKLELLIRIIVILSIVLLLGLTVYYAIFYFIKEESNYFLDHFASMCMMVLIGINAIFTTILNKNKISGDNKNDKLMIVVGILLIICGLLSLLISFIPV